MAASVSARRYAMKRRKSCRKASAQGTVLQMMKAASALSDEAGPPDRETGRREFAGVSGAVTAPARARAGSLVPLEGGHADAVCSPDRRLFRCPHSRRCRVLASPEAASYELSLQPLRQLQAVHETPPIATAAAQHGLAIGLRTTARSASELPNERQVLRVLASAHAAALNAQRASHPETATATVH